MGFILHFHEIYIAEGAGISLAISCRLRNLQSPTQWKDLWLFHTQNSYILSRPKPELNGYYVVKATNLHKAKDRKDLY